MIYTETEEQRIDIFLTKNVADHSRSVWQEYIENGLVKVNGKEETIHRKVMGIYPKHELVSSHICRRTFATLLYGEVDTMTIMKITGHQTERQFLGYIKITPKEYAEKLKAYWKSLKKIKNQ